MLTRPMRPSVEVRVLPTGRLQVSGGTRLELATLTDSDLGPDVRYVATFVRDFLEHASHMLTPERDVAAFQLAPPENLATWLERAAPMVGAEYLSIETLVLLWHELEGDLIALAEERDVPIAKLIESLGVHSHLVGRVCFHLAENPRSPETPFAFLATYATAGKEQSRARHLPLKTALQEYAGAKNRSALLQLLEPVHTAAGKSPFLQQLVDSSSIFQPQAWTAKQAHSFLKDVPLFEASGIVVRIPDWWTAKKRTRPEVSISLGDKAPKGVGAEALLDFSLELVMDGKVLSQAEREQLLASSDGLTLIKGRWVEVDATRLQTVLSYWEGVDRRAKKEGISFAEGMRLIAGAPATTKDEQPEENVEDVSRVQPGRWLERTLDALRAEPKPIASRLGARLHATLRPYQAHGVHWLEVWNQLGIGACLADDMGLGKTIQVLALFLLRGRSEHPHLLVLPASLLGNWQSEISRFCPDLRTFVFHPAHLSKERFANFETDELKNFDLVITTYGAVQRAPWISEVRWDTVVLDEAQAIKNAAAKQTQAVKRLQSRARVALTGTPIENRVGDLWSLFDFLVPGLLGSSKSFASFNKALREKGDYGPLRRLVRPYLLRRLKTDRNIIRDLPDKTELSALCFLSPNQAALYQQSVDALADQLKSAEGIKRRGLVLSFLVRFKQICNHPSHWLGDGVYDPKLSGKYARLAEICETIVARQEKLLVFTQFREMTTPLENFLSSLFARRGLVLHGEIPVAKRKSLVDDFQREDGPPFFVLSLKAGGTGLNLTAASHVVHFDRWWNPAVETQATDRAFRIGQKKNVLVHKFVCKGTIEERIDALIESKKNLSSELFAGDGEVKVSEMSNDEIMQLVRLDLSSAIALP